MEIIVWADALRVARSVACAVLSQLLCRGTLLRDDSTNEGGNTNMITAAVTTALNLQGILTDLLNTVTGLLGGVTGAL